MRRLEKGFHTLIKDVSFSSPNRRGISHTCTNIDMNIVCVGRHQRGRKWRWMIELRKGMQRGSAEKKSCWRVLPIKWKNEAKDPHTHCLSSSCFPPLIPPYILLIFSSLTILLSSLHFYVPHVSPFFLLHKTIFSSTFFPFLLLTNKTTA